ncbi:Peptidyl-prolyl cis-trans isomerase [Quillaja saponaria]|uniref:Peptidyl-prolyl cis-trans isomerase n=1 Tax=Quillaja saponaria TaxID=32244 RepID=A0AAD7PFF9_QUISA|nr:Peptidyl-prolyl cis-trans isomerase [Quillaja saponaria]
MELYKDVVPENFRALCIGEKGIGPNTGVPQHFKWLVKILHVSVIYMVIFSLAISSECFLLSSCIKFLNIH